MAKKNPAVKPASFPFLQRFSTAEIKAAKKQGSWMQLVAGTIAEQCGIKGQPQTPFAWLGTTPNSTADIGAKLVSIRKASPKGRDPYHRIIIELAAFNTKGECIAWNEAPAEVTFAEVSRLGAKALLLDTAAKKALTDLAKKGLKKTPKTAAKKTAAKKTAAKKTAAKKTAAKKTAAKKTAAKKTAAKKRKLSVEGKAVVVTGKFDRPRSAIEAELTAAGATIKSSVSSKTDLLVCGQDAGSKLAKAEALGLPIVDAKGLAALLGKTPAKKSPAKKSTAKKSTAKKSPAKKSTAKKSPAKKTAAKKQNLSVEGKAVVVTGKFDRPRSAIEAELTAAGATIKSSVSSKTDLLVCGQDAGSKLAKAEALGLPIVDAKGLAGLLGKTPAKKAKSPAKKRIAKKSPSKKARAKNTSLREGFEAAFAALAQRGVHFEYLRFGRPVSEASLGRIETKLGGPLDPALRSFFLEMDGLQCCYWIDPLAEPKPSATPKPKNKKALGWEETSNAFSALWKKINAMVEAWAEADCPKRSDGEELRVGIINIPDHKTMFTAAWDDLLCFEPGEYLFNANHHYRGEYLAYEFNPDTGKQSSLVVSASDSFAARYDDGGKPVAKYLKALLKNAGQIEVD